MKSTAVFRCCTVGDLPHVPHLVASKHMLLPMSPALTPALLVLLLLLLAFDCADVRMLYADAAGCPAVLLTEQVREAHPYQACCARWSPTAALSAAAAAALAVLHCCCL
jgi:hypothetical protein